MSAQQEWRATPMPALIVRDAIGPELAAEARARLAHAGYTPYALVDRGSYDHLLEPREPELLDALAGIAGEITSRRLVVTSARAFRLGPGAYVLTRHDRVHDDAPVELVANRSANRSRKRSRRKPREDVTRIHDDRRTRFQSQRNADPSERQRGCAVACHEISFRNAN